MVNLKPVACQRNRWLPKLSGPPREYRTSGNRYNLPDHVYLMVCLSEVHPPFRV